MGGRSLTVNAFDSALQPVELGASIFVKVNHVLYNATDKFHLPLAPLREGSAGDVTAIWDGEKFVYESKDGESWWWDVARMWWRYGMSPYRAVKLVEGVVGDFLKLYEEPWFPFRSLTQRVFELGLGKMTGVTGEQFLEQNKVSLSLVLDYYEMRITDKSIDQP